MAPLAPSAPPPPSPSAALPVERKAARQPPAQEPAPPTVPSRKIAFTPAPDRYPPINGYLIAAGFFPWLSLYWTCITLSSTLGADAEGAGALLWHLLGLLAGAFTAGLFVTAVRPQDQLWPAINTGVSIGLCYGLYLGLGVVLRNSEKADTPGALLAVIVVVVIVVSLVLLAPATILGGWVERRLAARSLRSRSPLRWIYKTRDGKKISVTDAPQYPLQANFWSLAGWIFLFSWFPVLAVGARDVARSFFSRDPTVPVKEQFSASASDLVRSLVPSVVMFQICGIVVRKRKALSAKEVLRQDARPPIIYLRSFRDDGRSTGQRGMLTVWTGRVYGILFRLGVHDFVGSMMAAALERFSGVTFEDYLARTLEDFGPFVAIGRPGEEVTELGAARMYVADEDWQAVVSDLMARPDALVIVQAGATAGLRWELETAGRVLRPDQLIIFLSVAFEGSDRTREEQYAAFRSWASECLPRTYLPDKFPIWTRFLYFSAKPAWKVHTLQRTSAIPPRHPLRKVLRDLQTSWYTLHRSRETPRWLVATLLVLGGLALLGIVRLFIFARKQPDQPPATSPAVYLSPFQMGAPKPPRTNDFVAYEGKAARYRLRLAQDWKPTNDRGTKWDRAFVKGSTLLQVMINQAETDLDTFPEQLIQGLKEGGLTPTLVEREKIEHEGRIWLHLKARLVRDMETGYLYVRIWSGGGRTFRLLVGTDRNDAQTREDIAQALGGFELPADP